MTPTPDPWEQLLPAALVGTARRAVPDTPDLPAPEADEAPGSTALLDRAALAAVRRAAGHTPHTAEPVEPAPEDDAPEVGAAASRHLAEILTTRAALLPEWLDLVARAGRRAPAAHLPTLLDRGARDSELRPAVAAAVGARGHWLARFSDTWHYLGSHGAAAHFDPKVWEDGAPPERRRALAALRRTDLVCVFSLLNRHESRSFPSHQSGLFKKENNGLCFLRPSCQVHDLLVRSLLYTGHSSNSSLKDKSCMQHNSQWQDSDEKATLGLINHKMKI